MATRLATGAATWRVIAEPTSLRCLAWAALVGFSGALTAARAGTPVPAASPPTPIDAQSDTLHGQSVADPYRWLEDSADPRVQSWSRAQAERTRAYLGSLPLHATLTAQLSRIMTSTSPAYTQLQAAGGRVFALYFDPHHQQPMLVSLGAAADPSSRRAIVDPNQLDGSGLTAIDWYVPSPDGRKVAVSLSKSGSEDGTLSVFDVSSRRLLEQPIPRVQYPTAGGSVAWSADSKGFWYTRYPGPEAPASERHFNVQVYFHPLGSPARSDRLALGHADGLERVSELFLDNRQALPAILAMVQRGDGNTWAYYLLRSQGPALRLASYDDGIVYASFGPDGALYGISRRGSSKGQIVKLVAPFHAGGLAHAPVLVPTSDVAILSGGAENNEPDLSFTRDRMFVRDIVGGPNQIRVFDLQGHPQGQLPLPPLAGNAEIAPLPNGRVLYDVTTYLHPRYYERWDPASGRAEESGLRQTSPISYADAEVLREMAVSKDGTQVPITLIHRRDVPLKNVPLLLYGYGGFGISLTPAFAGPATRLWLDGGGAYAIVNTRGGAEYGEAWHQQGMLTHKQNVFDDFYAAAHYLIERGYTSAVRLALQGASNGGLLMGAMITQHPSLARAVVSKAGLYDMVRFATDPNGAFNTSEYGSVDDAEQFHALYGYSPYHHVLPHTPYPAVLLLMGTNDGRVNPMHSRKFLAALQAASSSDLPLLLRVETTSGHGFGSSLDERIHEQADILSFLYEQLGLPAPAPLTAARAAAAGSELPATAR